MTKIYCWLRGIWWSFELALKGSPHLMSGHVIKVDEVHDNVTVEICHCEDCGKLDITWHK